MSVHTHPTNRKDSRFLLLFHDPTGLIKISLTINCFDFYFSTGVREEGYIKRMNGSSHSLGYRSMDGTKNYPTLSSFSTTIIDSRLIHNPIKV